MNISIFTKEGPITLDKKTQDYINGKIIDVPDYDTWRKEHPYLDMKEGERIVPVSGFYDKFHQIKADLNIEGLPVTEITFTNQGRINLLYYHHTEDNLYILGYVFFDKSLEELEELSAEEFKEFLITNLVSARRKEEPKVEDVVTNDTKHNVSGEIAEYRDAFLSSEMEYFLKLIEDPSIYDMLLQMQEMDPEELFEKARRIENKIETGTIENKDELEYMETLPPEKREEFHMLRLARAEGVMTIMLAAIGDKTLIKNLILSKEAPRRKM